MRSRQLHGAVSQYVEAAAAHLRAEVAAGAEVPFELDCCTSRGAGRGTPLYCYRALTPRFIAERETDLARLPDHDQAAATLERFDGLDQYLCRRGDQAICGERAARGRVALRLLLEDVFAEQTDFEVRPERLQAAIERLEHARAAGADELTVVATLHGLTTVSAELQVAAGLRIAHREAVDGAPPQAAAEIAVDGEAHHLLVIHSSDQRQPGAGLTGAREQLALLLRALRLFGDARVTLGTLAWARAGTSSWTPLALAGGGRPRGMLVVGAEQEDELRVFFNLVVQRAPELDELAWAMRRYELGCERVSAGEGLSDYLLALRALLEPEGPASGALPARVSALCAKPEGRAELAARVAQAISLESAIIAGEPVKAQLAAALADELGAHLRALLSDVICGHLDSGLAALADELLLAQDVPDEVPSPDGPDGASETVRARTRITRARPSEDDVVDDEGAHGCQGAAAPAKRELKPARARPKKRRSPARVS